VQRTFEALFRHLKSILLVLVVLPVIGLSIALVLPRSYQAEATLWALQRYAVIGATGTESNLLATPAETQATALTELLQTRAFALDVAKSTTLASTLPLNVRADQQQSDDALYAEISKHVVVGAQGYNLFVITYINTRATIAQQVVAAVIKEFGLQSTGFSAIEGQRLLIAYQSQLPTAQKGLDAAVQAETQYTTAHPSESRADLANDPRYAVLHAQTQQAQATLLDLQTKIAKVQSDISVQTGGDALYKIVDAPQVPERPMSRMKTFLMAGGGGLALALIACAIYLALLVRRDRALYTPLDIKRVAALPVLAQMPAVARGAVPVTIRPITTVAAVTSAPPGILNGHSASIAPQP
jgi:uncharacterized protein involved in exopolysaccharide biosynthesis